MGNGGGASVVVADVNAGAVMRSLKAGYAVVNAGGAENGDAVEVVEGEMRQENPLLSWWWSLLMRKTSDADADVDFAVAVVVETGVVDTLLAVLLLAPSSPLTTTMTPLRSSQNSPSPLKAIQALLPAHPCSSSISLFPSIFFTRKNTASPQNTNAPLKTHICVLKSRKKIRKP